MNFSIRPSAAILVLSAAGSMTACGGDDSGGPGPSIAVDGGASDAISPPAPDASEGDDAATGDIANDLFNDIARDNRDAPSTNVDVTSGVDTRNDVASDASTADASTSDAKTVDGVIADNVVTDVGQDAGGPTAACDWIKGDLHIHTNHSTDAMDTTVGEAFAKAESLGFGYFVVTDHDNHVEGKISTWSDPDYHSDKMIVLYGAEWTTEKGHANIFGTKPYDYAPIWAARDGDVATTIAIAHSQGLHFSVNHPAAKDLWEGGFDNEFDSMEVWTAPWVLPDGNPSAVTKWDELLKTGRRLGVRGGSDSHHQHDFESTLFNIGNPTTWICVAEKTGDAVLAALRAGHTSVSYAATAERLDFTADVDGDGSFETMVGDNVHPVAGKPIRFRIAIEGFRSASSYTANVFKNGTSLQSFPMAAQSVTFEDTPTDGERTYYRVELHGPTSDAPILSGVAFGDMIALTNAIYVAFP
jgi:hypothetical protein